jgi:ABC-2 type transport system ATP-binding protein
MGIVEIRNYLINLAHNNGVTIFISSHLLSEVTRMADRIAIINSGNLLQELDAKELEKVSNKRLQIKVHNIDKAVDELRKNGYSTNTMDDGIIEVYDVKAIEQPEQIAVLLVQANTPPTMLNIVHEDLESYFLRAIGERQAA